MPALIATAPTVKSGGGRDDKGGSGYGSKR